MVTPVNDKGCCKCRDKRCRVCDFLVQCMDFKSRVTGNNFVINFNVECNSDHVVYLLSCAKCEMQYVGSMGLIINLGSMPPEALLLKIRLRMIVYTGILINQIIRV